MAGARMAIVVGVVTAALWQVAGAVHAGEPRGEPPKTLRLTLDEAVRRAVLASEEIDAAEAGVQAARGRLVRARGGRLPSVEATLTAGPSPRARGDQVMSPDDAYRWAITGVFGRAEVRVIQPLYTFGKITAGQAAARAGIDAARAEMLARAAETSQRTIQAYLGLLLSRDALGLVAEVENEVKKALERRRARGADEADIGLLRLETFAAEAERGRVEAEAGVELAAAALAVLVEAPVGVGVEPAEESLARSAPTEAPPRALETYLEDLERRRPEFAQLRAGIAGREAEAALAAAERRPTFFVAGFVDVAGATNRERIHNPFVIDPINHQYAGAVLGLRWTFDFGSSGKVSEARAEAIRLTAQQAAARRGLPLEVRRAYIDLERALREADALERAFRTARRWTAAAAAAADLGVEDEEEVEDAFREYARHRADWFRALHNVRQAEANLRHAAGLDAEALAPLVLAGK